jgi:WD40 repeat protein/biotin carboxyl carrier protein
VSGHVLASGTTSVRGFAGTGAGRPLYDPVVIGPCNLTPLEEQEVSSQVEGTLKEVRVDLGQPVAADEVLAQLDDRLLRPQVESLKIKASSDSARLIAKAQLDDFQSKLNIASGLVARKAMAREEYHSLQCQRDRFLEEVKKAVEDQTMARKELDKALYSLAQHQVRSALAGEVTKVYKRAGESVRQGEPLFCVAKLDRLRVEGQCKVQQASLVKVGMRALVEPELRGEQMTSLSGHTATVTALAISADGRALASASEDRTVRLWSVATRTHQAVLPHPGEVFAIVFAPTRSTSSCTLLSGSADGRVRSWFLPAAGGATEPVTWPAEHEAAIRALACSPDGKWCASGGDDRRIGLWDLATGKLLYWVRGGDDGSEVAHHGAVTSLHFTPDGQLISAGRDNTIKVWQLGPDAATLVGSQHGRTGDVTQLGLSPDGRRVLFDHGEELRLLDWTDWTSQGTLQSRRQGRFQAFATFSPTGRLILTAASNGQLQLWTTPALPPEVHFFRQGYSLGLRRDALARLGGIGPLPAAPQLWQLDGYEVRHYPQPSPAALTCGVFSPDETMIFSSGADRLIHVWAVPPAPTWRQSLEAVVTYVGSQVERGLDMVRIRAELDNPIDPARRLRPGTFANLRLYPETAP